ncbi:hypothetical protein CNR22_15040 [Sphingobacteriaceae bacterium]|nr:hypothetical protein CNR22_15040 [Sphingobacteriaceae bacterium]
MVRLVRCIICLLFALCPGSAQAQELYFQSMAAKLNLPSDECYHVIQDKKGYIWIATENGLCRYNGNSIRIYNGKNGLPEKRVYFIEEEQGGDILLATSDGRIAHIVNDSIQDFPFLKAFTNFRKVKRDANVIYNMVRLNDQTLIVSDYSFSYRVTASGSISLAEDSESTRRPGYEKIDLRNSKPFVVKHRQKETSTVEQKGIQNVDFVLRDTVINLKYALQNGDLDGERVLICENENYFFISKGSKLFRLNKQDYKLSVSTFPNAILHLSHQSGGLWLGLRKSGLRYYPTASNLENFQKGLDGYSVSSVWADREGAVWCTTLEKNVFYCNTTAVTYYSNIKELSTRTSLMEGVGDSMIASTKFDELLVFYKNKLSKISGYNSRSGELTDVLKFKDHWYICSKGCFLVKHKSMSGFKMVTHANQKNTGTPLQLDSFAGKLYAISNNFVFKVLGLKQGPYQINLESRAKSLLCYNDEYIYVGCANGLYKIRLSDKKSMKVKGLSSEITKLERAFSGAILVGTREEGLLLLSNDTLKNICQSAISAPCIIFEVEQDKDGFVWVATNSGLARLNKTESGNCNGIVYNTSHGILSNTLYDLAITHDLIYASTRDGVFSIPKHADLSNKVAPAIYINSLKVNGEGCDFSKRELQFPHEKNRIEIDFDLLTFRINENSETLVYQLKGAGDSLKKTRNHLLSFENLAPASYELVVYALNNDGVRSLIPVIVRFTISPPFWKTSWFALAILFFMGLLIVLIVKKVVKEIRVKEKENTRINKLIAESQLSALQAQMNPHFIFNAINSIQNYILKQDEQKAFEYLGKFSKLIRMVLNHSRQASVNLSQELELLKLYVELEQLRFKDAFTFSIVIARDLDLEEIEIPTMLIQPYVENAVWHGLMGLFGLRKGHLFLDFSFKDNLLRILIEDNGVGQEQAARYKTTRTKTSLGMQLTGERLKKLNELRGVKGMKVQITDLKDDKGEALGTRVELFLVPEPDKFFYA